MRLRCERTIPSMTVMPTPGRSPSRTLSKQRLARRMLRAIHEDEIGSASDLDKPAVERPHARRVAGRKAEGDLRGNLAERSEQTDHPEDAEGLNARTRRGVGANNHAVRSPTRDAQGQQRRAFIAEVHEFETTFQRSHRQTI